MNKPTSESETLAQVYENVRALTKFYIIKSKDLDSFKRYEVNGVLLNSRYWLLAHLVWSEHMLLVESLTGKSMDIPWLGQFEYGSEPPQTQDGLPSLDEVMSAMNEVHSAAIAAIRSMTDQDLASETRTGMGFRNDKSKRMVIHHAIRHEPCHTGQLGWLCKIAGVETI